MTLGPPGSNREFIVRLLSVVLALVVFMSPIVYYTGRIVARLDQLGEDVKDLKGVIDGMKHTDATLTDNQKLVIENQKTMLELLKEVQKNGQSTMSR